MSSRERPVSLVGLISLLLKLFTSTFLSENISYYFMHPYLLNHCKDRLVLRICGNLKMIEMFFFKFYKWIY